MEMACEDSAAAAAPFSICTDSELLQPMSVLKRGMAGSMQASEFTTHVLKLIHDIDDSLGLKVRHLYVSF
jgi:hypothetical protein